VVAAGATLLLSPLTSAYPASIERRPDGPLLVKAQGEHFVFSERDEQRIFFLGPKLRRCAENHDFRNPNPFNELYGSLARWPHDLQLAPRFDSLVPTDSADPIYPSKSQLSPQGDWVGPRRQQGYSFCRVLASSRAEAWWCLGADASKRTTIRSSANLAGYGTFVQLDVRVWVMG
jgi:hypothetical protein